MAGSDGPSVSNVLVAVGVLVGRIVGRGVGLVVGFAVGVVVGIVVGVVVGLDVGSAVGFCVLGCVGAGYVKELWLAWVTTTEVDWVVSVICCSWVTGAGTSVTY